MSALNKIMHNFNLAKRLVLKVLGYVCFWPICEVLCTSLPNKKQSITKSGEILRNFLAPHYGRLILSPKTSTYLAVVWANQAFGRYT